MEKITIAQISRKQQPSKRNPGTTYVITNVKDTNGKIYSAFGKWAEGWTEGQTVEANVVEKSLMGSDGFARTVYNLENPNPSVGRFGPRNLWPQAYDLAVAVAINNGEKPISMDRVDTFAVAFHKRLENGPQLPTAGTPNVPPVDPNLIDPTLIPL